MDADTTLYRCGKCSDMAPLETMTLVSVYGRAQHICRRCNGTDTTPRPPKQTGYFGEVYGG